MSIQHEIKSFLSTGSKDVVISNHVSGFRVTIKDWQYGETSFETGSDIERMILNCIDRHDQIVEIRKLEKAKQLFKRRRELEADLEEVSTKLEALSEERIWRPVDTN
jgi:hypothetical protein